MLLTLLTTINLITHTVFCKNSREEEFSRIKHYELIEMNTNLFESAKIIDFIAFNQHYKIQLTPNDDLIPSKIRHTTIDIHQIPTQHQYLKSLHETCHYFGNVINTNTDSTVALSFCPKRGIRGRITAFNQTILIKPSAHYFDFKNAVIKGHDITDELLVYKLSDFDLTNIGQPRGINMLPKTHKYEKQLIKETNNKNQPQRRRLYSSSSPAVIELLIINGPERTKRFQNDYPGAWYSALIADIGDIINQVSADYLTTDWGTYIGGTNAVTVKWVELEVVFAFTGDYRTLTPNWLKVTCPVDGIVLSTSYADCPVDGYGWISGISNWVYTHKDISTFDNVQLISDMTFSPNVAGWARPAQVCQGSDSVSDITERWGHDYVAKILAHELGHNLGMSHDGDVGCDGSDYIMGRGFNGFSSCSVSSLQNYMSANSGLTCLRDGHEITETRSNFDQNEQIPPTTTTTIHPTPSPTNGGDNTDDWTCFGMRSVKGITGFNGNWAQSGVYDGKNAFYLNGYYLYYLSGWGLWCISLVKGSESVKSYCKNADLQACTGSFRTLSSTGIWVDEVDCQFYNCQDTPSIPTPPPVNTPETPSLPCTNYNCLRIRSMDVDSDGRSYNGDWSPNGCHNEQAYYILDGQTDRKLCYSSGGMWMITENLCPSGRTIAYSPQRPASEIMSTQNNWNVFGPSNWNLDRGVTITPCDGAFIDDDESLDCITNNEYNDNLCIYSNKTLWSGEKNFELHPGLCSHKKPVYKYTIYNISTDDDDIGTDKDYDNINVIRTYYLHYYEKLLYSDGTEMVGKWIITQDEITIKALATCEKENLIECSENSWIVDKVYEGEEVVNGTDRYDGWFEKVIDEYMMVTNDKCELKEEEEERIEEKNNVFLAIVIICIGVIILIGCIGGCCLWYKREYLMEKVSLKNNLKRVSDGDTIKLDDSDGENCDGRRNGGLNKTQMIEVEVEITDDDEFEVGTPLNNTTR